MRSSRARPNGMMIWMSAASTPSAGLEEKHPSGADQVARKGEPTIEGAYAADGVDLTVIRWMLDRSPEERLQAAQDLIDAASAVRGDED